MSEHLAEAVVAGIAPRRPDGVAAFGGLVARAIGRPLVLVSAYEYEPSSLSPVAPQAAGNAERYDQALNALAAISIVGADDVQVEREVVPALDIAEALVERAERHDAALVAVGSDLGGAVARHVLRLAPCPIVVVPAGAHVEVIRRVGVAFDGSPGSRVAAVAALAIAEPTRADVVLLGVAPPSGPTLRDPTGVMSQADHRAAALEREAHTFRVATDSRVSISSRVLRGETPHTLAAATSDLDLIACGSRRRGRVVEAVLGSTSQTLARYSFCPVLVVPPRMRARPGGPLGLRDAAA